ncbi:MAG: MATE family efflux transporter [Chlorobi bacterium]|nr:MATE family efflux transporter [Chlorobiota bacterium]
MDRNQKNVKELESSSISRLMWKYFLPAFASVIINSLYNIVDRIYIGQGIGALALSGLSAVFPIMMIMMAFGMLIGMGAGVRVSLNMGKKDFARAEKVLGNAFVLVLIISVIITFIGFIIEKPLLEFFGIGDKTFKYADEYLRIILWGTVFNITGYSLNNIIRSEGNAKIAMISIFIAAGLNIILDPVFIFWLKMGVKGAAAATVISQFVLFVWVLLHFSSSRSLIKLKVANLRLSRDIIWHIVTIGFAPFAMQVASSFVFGTYNIQLVKYGDDIAVGAMGIIMSVAMMLIMSVIAINMASQPITGFNYGAKNYDRVKRTLVIGLISATVISVSGFVVSQLFPESIIRLFNHDDPELLKVGVHGLRIFLMALPLIGFQIITSNYFQATGKAGTAAFLSLMRQVIILIPLLFLLPKYFGLTGVWMAGPVSDAISAMVVSVFLIKELRRLNVLKKLP